jgi:hypothetical protein
MVMYEIFFAWQNEPQTIFLLDVQTDDLLTRRDEAHFFSKEFPTVFEGSTFFIDFFLNYECGVYTRYFFKL